MTETFTTVTASPQPRRRSEAELQREYTGYLARLGHTVNRRQILLPDGAGLLLTDAHVEQTDELIEVKSSIARNTLREALGQILDYARYLNPAKRH